MLLSDQASVHSGLCGHGSESSDTANSLLALSRHQMPISLLPELCRDRIQHHVFRGSKVFHRILSTHGSSWRLEQHIGSLRGMDQALCRCVTVL